MEQLPAVAKSIYTVCKKCDTDRFHKVLSHVSAVSAKVQCEVCGAKKTYSTEKKKTASPSQKKAAKEKATRMSTHEKDYQDIIEKSSDQSILPYVISGKFEAGTKISHPKFGVGIVRTSSADRIEVIFSDEVKNLIQGR